MPQEPAYAAERRQDAEAKAAFERAKGMRAPIRVSGLVVRSERPAMGRGQPEAGFHELRRAATTLALPGEKA